MCVGTALGIEVGEGREESIFFARVLEVEGKRRLVEEDGGRACCFITVSEKEVVFFSLLFSS